MLRTILLLPLFITLSSALTQESLGDRLKGLVYKVEEWTEPKDAWLLDQIAENRWTLSTQEESIRQKHSKGKVLKTPVVRENRTTPEAGAPPLHTRITSIPKGYYSVSMNAPIRRLALSLDGGRTWKPSRSQGEEHIGFFQIDDGVFDLWVDDRYATPGNVGSAFYDYIRFEEAEAVDFFVDEPIVFTLPDGSTQISWISSVPLPAGVVLCTDENGQTLEFKGTDTYMRNHRVVLKGLTAGKKYTARIETPLNQAGTRSGLGKTLTFVAGARPVPPPTTAQKVKLTVSEPTKFGRKKGYVTSGVPFAHGRLADPNDVVLQNEKGEQVEAQFDVMATWGDGSVQWLLCDFVAETTPEVPAVYYLVTASNVRKETVKKQADEERIEKILKRFASELLLSDGTKLTWQPGPIEYETDGTIRTSVRSVGDYLRPDGTPFFRWRAHLSFFENDWLRIRWALCNNNETADHSLIRSAFLSLDLPGRNRDICLTDGKIGTETLSILQDQVDNAVISLDGRVEIVKQSDGFVRIGDCGYWMRDFWQTWPKGLTYRDGRLRFDILPQLPTSKYPPDNWTELDGTLMHWYWYKDGCYQFKRGMELQTEMWLVLDEQVAGNAEACAAWLAQPLFAVADPSVYCESGVFPPINPRRDDVFDTYEKAFDTSFAELEKGRQQRAEYGWMNFGDWFGERRWNWGNNEYDLSYVCAMHFARTGNLDFLKRAEEMTRHYTTIDVNFFPRSPRTRELVYAHSIGHVGGFLQKEDPRLTDEQNLVGNVGGYVDTAGGHCHQAGNFHLACLMGDKRFFEVAEMVCTNQAKYYTPSFDFLIERAPGWLLTNAMAAYHFTQNPFYLQAGHLYFEAILLKQNIETGGFDMLQDTGECDCLDRKEHRGGKTFAAGVLLHGLVRYYEQTGRPEVRQVIVRCADWLLDHSWDENVKKFRYKTGCPKYANGRVYDVIVTEGIAYAGELTGCPRFIDFLARTLGGELGETSNSSLFPHASGLLFSGRFRHLPHTLYYLEKHGHQTLQVDW